MNWALAALSAVLSVLLFPEWNIHLFAPVALAPLLVAAAREPSWKRRALFGELAGFLYWLGVCNWTEWVLEHHGAMDRPLALLALVLMCVVKGALWSLFTVLAGPIMRKPWAVPAIAALWTGIERLNSPQGFAWLTLGNAGIEMGIPLRLAPYTGVYGLSFVFAMLGAAVAVVVLRRPRFELAPAAVLAGLFALPAIPDEWKVTEEAVALQPNVPQSEHIDARRMALMLNQMVASTAAVALDPERPHPPLLLWPESPAPLYFEADAGFRQEVQRLARLAKSSFLFGTVLFTPGGAPLNSAQMVGPEGNPVARYDKMYLVPFGEFIPPMFGWINRITQEAGDFEPGTRFQVMSAAGHGVGAFICYESAFPHLVRRFAEGGGEVLVNMTNDGYFGRSAARQQHLLLARMRAVENRRWLLRPTNDGYTAAIDPAGRVRARLEPFQATAGRLGFSWIRENTLYSRYGDWFAWGCLALGLGLYLAALLPSKPRVPQSRQ
ncbi:MAG: apolipoprotein N-acyltransferase [Bryobacteraceae bacterium]